MSFRGDENARNASVLTNIQGTPTLSTSNEAYERQPAADAERQRYHHRRVHLLPGIDQPLGVRRGGAQYYFATDANGNVLAITDSTGAVKNQYRYSPYGVGELATETFFNPLRYAGREWDPDAGLYFNRARWYDPQLQRFISQDPIGVEGGLNLYAYAGDDPVNGSDPSGLFGCRRLPVGFGLLQDRGKGEYNGPYFFEWECDFYGAPPDFLSQQRTCPQLFSAYWTCNGDGDFLHTRPECQRDPDGTCHLYVPARQWASIGTMFRRIPDRPARCAGAKRLLLAAWEQGPGAARIQFWDGADLVRDSTGKVVGQSVGYNAGPYVAYDSYWFYRDSQAPAHEGLHQYYDLHPPSWYTGGSVANAKRMERFVHRMDDVCAVR